MNERPRASLGRVLDDLGDTLLELVHGDGERPDEIDAVVIHDPMDEPAMPPHALVLGVGLRPEDALGLLPALGRQRAVGLVLRSPVTVGPELARAADEAAVVLLSLTRGATWAQLAALLRSVLAEGDVGVSEPDTLGGMPSGDLFTLANAISSLLDAPITIEDRNSRVLAFSGRQHEADASRVETILGRQVPERYSRMLTERGVFGELYRSAEPLFIEPLPTGNGNFSVPRTAVAVRAGDEILGSIWAAAHEPLSAERSHALVDAAKLVALHLLRVRAGADVQRRLRADLVSTALEGGIGARDALSRLGLADQPVAVVAVGVLDVADTGDPETRSAEAPDASLTAERERLSDALAVHLSAIHPRSAAALVGDTAYGLIPLSEAGPDGQQRAARIAGDFLDRIGRRVTATVGVGPVTTDPGALAGARATADRVLRVLRTHRSAHRVATLAEVQVESLLLELRDLVTARGDQPTGPIARLQAYDARHNTHLVQTLRAWLDAFGDVVSAAAAVYVHPNTFRYRLRRLAEVGGMDLADPEARFAAMVQLRVVAPGG